MSEKLVICGGPTLQGEVAASGSKNAALPIMAACLLAEDPCHLTNIPILGDITVMSETLRELGAEIETSEHQISIAAPSFVTEEACAELVKRLRASVLVLGPLVARRGRARVALPGGCKLGLRPVDLHLEGLSKLGVSVEIKNGYIEARTRSKLRGATISLRFPSVGATENIILAAALADGTTTIQNASYAPEIIDLCQFLRKTGVNIKGVGTNTLLLTGTREIRPVEYAVIPDRIEVGTLLLAAGITRGNVLIHGVNPNHLQSLVGALTRIGFNISSHNSTLQLSSTSEPGAVTVTTSSYPGFPTDLQPQLTTLACTVSGKSVITETVFEHRFSHIAGLQKMGAHIDRKCQQICVYGGAQLKGAKMEAPDIRGGASLILAGLAAEGTTEISNMTQIDRGYEHIENKLSRLGADIKRVED